MRGERGDANAFRSDWGQTEFARPLKQRRWDSESAWHLPWDGHSDDPHRLQMEGNRQVARGDMPFRMWMFGLLGLSGHRLHAVDRGVRAEINLRLPLPPIKDQVCIFPRSYGPWQESK